tara:strand:+ start:2200 stop:2517 length:318 start_codon:yes stop_codon:yes gene_type:complete
MKTSLPNKPRNKRYPTPPDEWYYEQEEEEYEDEFSIAYYRLMQMFGYNYENTFNDFPLDEDKLLFKTNLEESIRIKEKQILYDKIEKRNKWHRENRKKFNRRFNA